MKARTHRRGTPGKVRPPTPPRKDGRRAASLLAVGLAGVLVAGGIAWWASARLAGSAATFAARAREAEERGDLDAALALYRDGLRRHPDDAVLLGSLATAIQNRSYAVRTNRGKVVPLTPTSRERVDAALATLRLLDESEQARPRNPQPAMHRGLLYAAWGLPEDALVELYRARVLGSTSPEIDRVGGAITLLQLGQGDSLDAAPVTGRR